MPERTHYLPDDKVDRIELDPPLKQAWSVNTHALIEFPPAIHHGVAYVINKYGNGKAVRLRDRKVLWELKLDPKTRAKPIDVTGPVFPGGKVYCAFLDGILVAGDAQERQGDLEATTCTPNSNPRRWSSAARSTSAPTRQRGRRFDAADGKVLWQFNGAGGDQSQPQLPRRASSSSPTTRARCSPSTRRPAR